MTVRSEGADPPSVIDMSLLEAERANPESRKISDERLAEIMTAIVRLYAARVESTGAFPKVITQDATATDALLVACEMVGFHDINMFDFTMWYDRRRSQ
ncbi:MAG: hypothetical protein ACK4MV_04310 [Beijerinckiaceae bacterium]